MFVSFTYYGVACGVLSINDEFRIGIDPDLAPKGSEVKFKGFSSVKTSSPYDDKSLLDEVDLWLLTHGHQDHLDKIGKRFLAGKNVICQSNTLLKELPQSDATILKWGKEKNYFVNDYQITIKAIPAYHASNLFMQKMLGKVNGYLISIANSSERTVIYFTGDTIYSPKLIKELPDGIDVVFVNLGAVKTGSLGGPFTMNLQMLEQLKHTLKPKEIFPIHIDDYSHYMTTKQEVERQGYKVILIGEKIDISK